VRALYDSRISTPPTRECYFPNAKRFTDCWLEIRREALAIATTRPKVPRIHDIMAAQADISDNDGRDWHIFIMKAYAAPEPARRSLRSSRRRPR